MRVIALEEHFILPLDGRPFPPGAHVGNDRELLTGIPSGHALLEIGAERIAAMDEAGIDVQVLSLNQPGCQAPGAGDTVALARQANDYLYEKMLPYPMRFAGLASVSTSDAEAGAKELERAVSKLSFKGAVINGHTDGSFLDDKKYWAIFECAEALRVPIYLHPRGPHPDAMKTYFNGYTEIAAAAWGFAMDTCSHFLRMMLAGVFDRYPNLVIILGHMGEGLPFWLHRLNDHTQLSMKRRGLKKTAKEYICDNVMITCSGNFSVPAMVCSVMALGVDRVMFSVDWPYESNVGAVQYLKELPFDKADLEKIASLNASRLLRIEG